MDKLDKKIEEYVDTFRENVPVFSLPSMSTDELIDLIDDALKTGKPIKPDIPDDPEIFF